MTSSTANTAAAKVLAATSPVDRDFLTTLEIAERYRTTLDTVWYWRSIGYGPVGVKVGRRVLYPRAEVERFDSELTAKQAS